MPVVEFMDDLSFGEGHVFNFLERRAGGPGASDVPLGVHQWQARASADHPELTGKSSLLDCVASFPRRQCNRLLRHKM